MSVQPRKPYHALRVGTSRDADTNAPCPNCPGGPRLRGCVLSNQRRRVSKGYWMTEIYVSTDVEADGPIPGPNSMLSFGSAAYTASKNLLDTFTANLELLPGASPDLKTMEWWKTKPEAWEACRKDLQFPEVAIKQYLTW